MNNIHHTESEDQYWSKRYKESRTGWDIGYPSLPIQTYIDQLEDTSISILIPGAGNAYEAEYLFKKGFEHTFIMDISVHPLEKFKERVPDFPVEQLLHQNFFEHSGQYDLIFEQTFFCSFPPTPDNRKLYAKQIADLLKPNGKLVGIWFDKPLTGSMEKRPFGGTKEEYKSYLQPYFTIEVFERCYNSIPPRMGEELFGICRKK